MLKKMRQCRLNFAENRYDCEAGIIGEHYATELIVTPPVIMPSEAVYRLCFEPGGLSEIILQTTDGTFSYPLPSAVTATSCCVTLIGYVGSEQIYKSRMVRLHFSQTADGDSSIDLQQPGIVDEVNRNTAARHGHDNKSVIDLLTADDTGTLLYDGKVIGGGASDFIIKMTVTSDDNGKYTVTSCSTTVEQIDAAVSAEKRLIVIASADGVIFELPMLQGIKGNAYYFGTFLMGQAITTFAQKVGENESKWQFSMTSIEAGAVNYSNAALPNISTVEDALNELVPKSHTHATGTNITLADNTEYRLTDVTTLTLTYPTGNFECWMRLNFATSGNVTVTLPTGTKYIGTAPDFKNGETWELSFKDKILAAQKVGEGT